MSVLMGGGGLLAVGLVLVSVIAGVFYVRVISIIYEKGSALPDIYTLALGQSCVYTRQSTHACMGYNFIYIYIYIQYRSI